jgi:chitinase
VKKCLLAYVGSGEINESDAKKLTHINIAFGQLNSDGTVTAKEHDKVQMISLLRKWNPELKIVLSLIGSEPNSFSECCKTNENREAAAKAIAKAVDELGLDGVDLDWEYPCVPSNGSDTDIQDKVRFTLFCKVIRDALDALKGNRRIFSIAAGADLYYVHCVELKELSKYLDYICLMTYDLKCGFHALAGHHTALYSKVGDVFRNSCDQALRLFHESGVPKEKLLMGAAFYSRKWTELENRNHGLLQICKTGGNYGPDYDVLEAEYINKNGYIRYWDEEAKAPFLFNGSTFISYDDEESLRMKAQYVNENEYAGIFYWEHKCDKTRKLLKILHKELKSS